MSALGIVEPRIAPFEHAEMKAIAPIAADAAQAARRFRISVGFLSARLSQSARLAIGNAATARKTEGGS
jgi:hypothetical protein